MAPRVQLILHTLTNATDPTLKREWSTILEETKQEISVRSQHILYGTQVPGERERYLKQYGCVRWTEDALRQIATFSPLIEIGAGAGHWQKALTAAGSQLEEKTAPIAAACDIVAFDSFDNRYFTDDMVILLKREGERE